MNENVLVSSLSASEIAEILMQRIRLTGLESFTFEQAKKLNVYVRDLLLDLEENELTG